METGKMRLALSAGALALSMALAGCGGSSSSGGAQTTNTGGGGDPDDGGGGNGGETQKTSLSYAGDLDTSVAALMTLAGGATKDGSALKMATDNMGKIGTLASDGNSRAAMMSAQMVLDARDRLMRAIEAAKSARRDATDAKDDTENADVIAALDGAIARANTQIEDAEEVLKGNALRDLVADITGCPKTEAGCTADTTPKAPGRDAAYHGKQVADVIAEALESDTSITLVATEAPDAVKEENRFSDHDAMGMTWAEIVGEGDVKSERIGASNAARMVASVAGMTAADVDSDVTATGGTDSTNKYADAFTSDSSTYKGIPGEIFCLGKDCEVDTNGKLVGSWYFSPTSPMAYYTKNADDENYSPETLYATYGHWLTVSGETATVHTFAHFGGTTGATPNTPGVWSAADPSSDDAGLKLSTATYSGKAAGRSVRRVVATDGSQSGIHSGRFTADVTLTAQFATAPMLGGTIRNFQSPDNPSAVGNWTVKLTDTAVSSGTLTGGTVNTEPANVTGGGWSATSYGEADKRPTGIYGGFRAHFTDGDVAGAYATRHR